MSRDAAKEPFTHAALAARWVERAAAAFLIAAAAYVTASSLRLIVREHVRVPYWDQWQELLPRDFLARPFSQHNEHRIFVGRLVFALDTWVGAGRGVLSLVAVLLALGVTVGLLGVAARRSGAPRSVLVATVGLGLTFLLCAYTWECLLAPFNASYVDVCPFAVAAFVLLGAPGGDEKHAALEAAVAAVLAAYSIASGLVVLLLVVAVAVLTRRSRRDVALLGLVAVVTVATYLVGYEAPGQHARPAESLRHPTAVAQYVSVYLGAPFSSAYVDRVRAARIFGELGVLAWGVCVGHAVARRRGRPEAWVFVGTATFALGWAVMTALGRANFPIDQAFAPRYGTCALLFWAALILDVACLPGRPMLRAFALIVACVLSGVVVSEQKIHGDEGARNLARLRDAETALVTGGLERETIDRITPAASLVRNALPDLRREHLGVFSAPWASWLGEPLVKHVPRRDDDACIGFLDHARPVAAYGGPAFRVDGWAFSRRDHERVARVAMVDRHGIVVGLAAGGFSRTDAPKKYPEVSDPSTGFVGHIGELGDAGGWVTAFAVLADGRTACKLERSARLNASRARSLVVE